MLVTEESSGWNTPVSWRELPAPSWSSWPRRPAAPHFSMSTAKPEWLDPTLTDVSCEPGRVFTCLARSPSLPESCVRSTFVHFSRHPAWDAAEDYLPTSAGTERRIFLTERPQENLEDPCLERTGLVHLVIFIFPPTYSSVIPAARTDGRSPGAAARTCRHDAAKDFRKFYRGILGRRKIET